MPTVNKIATYKKIEHKFKKNTFQLKISSNSRPLESFQFKLCNLHNLQKLTLFQGNKYNNMKIIKIGLLIIIMD